MARTSRLIRASLVWIDLGADFRPLCDFDYRGKRDATRELLLAIVSCKLAWGIICGEHFSRTIACSNGAPRVSFWDIRRATSDASDEGVLTVGAGELDPNPNAADSHKTRRRTYNEILGDLWQAIPPKTQLKRGDLFGAMAVFTLATLTSVPAILPFLFIEKLRLALRVANLSLILMLFLIDHRWAGMTKRTAGWLA